jgi:hypothetical protein
LAKITLGTLVDVSRYLATDAGKQLADFIPLMADVTRETVSALKNGLNFQDNFDAEIKTVTLTHNVEQIMLTRKQPMGIVPMRVVSTSVGIDGLAWYINQRNQVVVKATLTGSPVGAQSVVLAIFF